MKHVCMWYVLSFLVIVRTLILLSCGGGSGGGGGGNFKRNVIS